MLMSIIPYAVGCIGASGYSAAQLYREIAKVKFDANQIADLIKGDSSKFAWLVAGVVGPYLGTQLWWNTLYHPWGTEDVDTCKYVTFKVAALHNHYKNIRIPICELY